MDKRLTDITDPSVIMPVDDCGDLYFKLFNHMYDGLSLFEVCGSKIRALYLNERYFDNVGYTPEQYRPYLDNITVTLLEEDEQRIIGYSEKAENDNAELYCEVRGYRHDGSLGWFWVRARKVDFIKSEYPVFLAAINDISERKELEHQLTINRERYHILEETISALLFEYTPSTDRMVFSVKGNSDQVIENYSMYLRRSDRVHPHDVNYYYNTLCKACRKPIKGFIDLRSYYSAENDYCPYRVYYSSIADEFGSVISVVGRIEPIGKEHSAQLIGDYSSGDCYGLMGSGEGIEEIERRIGSGSSMGFLTIIDIDGSSLINKKYGKNAGDHAVRMTAKLLKEVFADSVIFRYFGDSFVVYTENITEGMLYDMFEKLSATAGTLRISDGDGTEENIGITFSAGTAYTRNGTDKSIRLKDYSITADKALFRAKMDGGAVMYAEKIIF